VRNDKTKWRFKKNYQKQSLKKEKEEEQTKKQQKHCQNIMLPCSFVCTSQTIENN